MKPTLTNPLVSILEYLPQEAELVSIELLEDILKLCAQDPDTKVKYIDDAFLILRWLAEHNLCELSAIGTNGVYKVKKKSHDQ